MKALVLEEIGKLTLKEVETPVPGRGEVLLRIHACGICSSDKARLFKNGTHTMPLIPGHEISGEIVAGGPGIREELIGRRAAVFPLIPCRQCDSCRIGKYAQCEHYDYFGSRRDGGFAEYLAVPVFNINLLPDDMDYHTAALCEPATVASHALKRAKMKSGDIVTIIGTGTVGLLAAGIARIRRASKIIIVGRSKEKIMNAAHFADHVINAEGWDVNEAVASLTEGHMSDVVLETGGNSDACTYALMAAGKGTTVMFIGNPEEPIVFNRDIYWKILRNELTLKGTWNSGYAPEDNDWNDVIRYMADGQIPADKIITDSFPLEDYNKAFELLLSDRFYTKIMFDI
ncbi:MAG TPA: galactitol-1-phosphate 5-dehydrogenase [Lachnospiraceae bacterium]|nr:galactitol-1-phosphate 5-dehydrogenase [Lachnospiraceae bacterium]